MLHILGCNYIVREQPWLSDRIHDCASRVQIPEKTMAVAGRVSDLNSLLNSNKSLPVNQEQTLRPHTGINNVEYKLISVPLMIISIAVYIGYVEITS